MVEAVKTKAIFVSYSSQDKAKADEICKALEAAGVSCWIAPRDLQAGSQWGGGIVEALQACQAVLVLFSSASNDSPQVAREMEIAVSNRKPLIPVRVENAQPTKDMQYFLGVSHWFNAYPAPIGVYLPEIVASTQTVLKGEAKSWRRFQRKLPQGRWVLPAIGAAAAGLLALAAMQLRNPAEAFKTPLEGRWQTEVKTASGDKAVCILDVKDMGQAVYSEDCPAPLQGASGSLAWMKGATWAPNLFKEGDDTGTFLFQGGSAHGYAAAFKKGWFGLRTRDAALGELKWKKISGAKPLKSAVDDILPKSGDWPLSDVPAVAGRAVDYARGHWKNDAVLMGLKAERLENGSGALQTPAGAVTLTFELYSPSTQQGLSLTPGGPAGAMFAMGSVDRNPGRAMPSNFLDLPAATAQARTAGMRGQEIRQAELGWGRRPCGTGNFAIDNAILPRCPPGEHAAGPQWVLDSGLNERFWIPAGTTAPSGP